MALERYPIDFDSLEKDSWLETELLVHALQASPADGPKWSFGLVGLCSQIEKETGILGRIDHNRIRLMGDVESDEYTSRRLELHVAGMTRVARRRALIDRESMTLDQQQLAERRDRMVFAVAVSARSELRKQRLLQKLVHQPTAELPEESE